MGGICDLVQVIAHRGASRAEAENTVAAFRRACEMGADAVELDVRRTADGVLVVRHDERLPDGRSITATDVSQLPPGVPLLGDALDSCAGMWVNVEIKNDPADAGFDPTDSIADETIANLLARDEDQRWVISCFRIETIDRCRALAPSIRTAWLTVAVPSGSVEVLAARGHAALHPWVGELTSDVVDDCHRLGLAVNTWTCDDPVRMAELIEWGVDGICTNVPDIAITVRSGRPA